MKFKTDENIPVEAAEDLRTNREGFKRNVRTSMAGGAVKGRVFEKVTK